MSVDSAIFLLGCLLPSFKFKDLQKVSFPEVLGVSFYKSEKYVEHIWLGLKCKLSAFKEDYSYKIVLSNLVAYSIYIWLSKCRDSSKACT